ncbi:glycoside hydrolase family 2 protein [Methylobacterium sp. E-005]|uniref:glycosyl hydrolase 2 galactose-binding domain-containing protein n=1 Tax=Methylobacterium sp. E-005 TaxID=2836549 RepID=UPI001FB9F2EC|nr:glycoside hydrolase family 2 protein [Methylobacterium sp. E-005]MCJ2090892.1 glycoside hydrolase family 2 protein [Methylobacterium sp. E-005]
MALIRSVDGRAPVDLPGPWRLALTSPGACAGPGDLDGVTDWIPAAVPGTAASALQAAGRWSETAPSPIHDKDVWYRTRLNGPGRFRLRFDGLATLAEIWLDGVPILTTRSMFEPHAVAVDLAVESDLALCFRSLRAELDRPAKRGRWRPRMITPGSLRHVRTSALGFMPGWAPEIDHVGPTRPITVEAVRPGAVSADLRASLDGETGRLSARLTIEGGAGAVTLRCDGRETPLVEAEPGLFAGEMVLPAIAPWWPHTHGTPNRHAVTACIDGATVDLGRVGFRSLSLTRPFEEGLSLAVNGVPVFCRGAVWMPPDLVGLGLNGTRTLLMLAREAGMNMLRVPGTTLYPATDFFDLCDELGILVWQDLMLANFDYPHDDPDFARALTREITAFLDRTQTAPSLAILCGGSEVWQQAAMLGAPRAIWADAYCETALPPLAAAQRPDIVVVPNSPSGGALPFSPRGGCTHYFGVGAYCRPLDDARRAEVGFASECLAFANPPEPGTPGPAGPTDPDWSAGIPRDRGADWDFETVRDHYVGSLYDVDPAALRAEDPERYLDLGRAAVAEVMEATFAEWCRPRSPTAGGLVLMLRDLGPGAGWGVIDWTQRPKSAWYALKRAFRPVQILITDEGLDGLHLHLVNETAQARALTVALTFTDRGGRVAGRAERAVDLDGHASLTLTSADLLGRFFDATDSYRFGPRIHDIAHARLTDADGQVVAESFHFPGPRPVTQAVIGLTAEPVMTDEGPALRVATERFAFGVQVCAPGARADDTGFHLAPGTSRLIAFPECARLPRGTVRAINGTESVEFGHDA